MTTFQKIAMLLLVLFPFSLNAQQAGTTLTQSIHGQITDAASKQSLPGVIVLLLGNTNINTTSDANGYYILSNVPVGRQSFAFTFVGYEPFNASEIAVISGKETELNVSLKESLTQLQEVTVSAGKDRSRPQNEFAQVSARSFSVEEARRYAAAFSDPARMVMNFPGVSSAGDMENGIVVRGNSPKGVLWRMEGIEIPNPNHFGSLGATGGAISMLNANTLGNSDFYTGAFPAEIGNALAGAFDLTLRNGNSERREHTVQIGALGMEVATEGPLGKNKGSYLLNYRYSTLALLGGFLDLGGVTPNYQDGSFKINLPTKNAGTFSLFGLGGMNTAQQKAKPDSSEWDGEDETSYSFNAKNKMAVAGITHQYFLNKDAYIRTILSGSYDNTTDNGDTLNPADNYRKVPTDQSSFTNTAVRLSVLYNQKLNARHTLRTGVIGQQLGYDFNARYYDNNEDVWKNLLSSDGSTQFYQAYLQWKYRATDRLTLAGGVHASHLALNGKSSIEPRVSAAYEFRRQRYTLAAGLHSKPDHISTYLFENTSENSGTTDGYQPNKNLDLLRAFHAVAGWGTGVGKWKFKAEAYYQHLYNIPVGQDSNTSFSMLNAESLYSLLALEKPLVSKGTGDNYGIDLSIERPFSNGYYVIATGSIYTSTYKDFFGTEYHTCFDRGYQANLIGGKEFKLSPNGKRILGVNGKILTSGGMRESVIDVPASIANGETEYVPGQYYTHQTTPYFRTDIGLYYKRNRRRSTHTIQLDVQNVTNRQNIYGSYFDAKAGKVKTANQLGFFPNLSYRIDFQW